MYFTKILAVIRLDSGGLCVQSELQTKKSYIKSDAKMGVAALSRVRTYAVSPNRSRASPVPAHACRQGAIQTGPGALCVGQGEDFHVPAQREGHGWGCWEVTCSSISQ